MHISTIIKKASHYMFKSEGRNSWNFFVKICVIRVFRNKSSFKPVFECMFNLYSFTNTNCLLWVLTEKKETIMRTLFRHVSSFHIYV